MPLFILAAILLSLTLHWADLAAQTLLPTVTAPISGVSTLTSRLSAETVTVDLRRHFGIDGVAVEIIEEGEIITTADSANPLVYMNSSMGPMVFELQQDAAPQTSSLFLNNVKRVFTYKDFDDSRFNTPPFGAGTNGNVTIHDERPMYDNTLVYRSLPPAPYYDDLDEDYLAVFRQRFVSAVPLNSSFAAVRATFPGSNNDILIQAKTAGSTFSRFIFEFRYDQSLTGDTARATYNEQGALITRIYLNRGETTANTVVQAIISSGIPINQWFTFGLDSQAVDISDNPDVDVTNDGTGVVNAEPQPDDTAYLEGGIVAIFGHSSSSAKPGDANFGVAPTGVSWEDILNPYLSVEITERNTNTGLSNTRGTLGLLLEQVDFPGGAGKKYTGLKWVLNTQNNADYFDNDSLARPINAFGRALGSTLDVADAINGLRWFDNSSIFNDLYSNIPLQDSYQIQPGETVTVEAEDLVLIQQMREISLFEPSADTPALLNFTLDNWSGPAQSVIIDNYHQLRIIPQAGTPGEVVIRVTARDLHGNTASQTFTADILPADYQTWRGYEFSEQDAGNDLISGASADPEQDTLTNLEEYLFGTAPLDVNLPNIRAFYRSIDGNGERTGIIYPQALAVTGLTTFIERYSTGNGWEELPSSIHSTSPDSPYTQLITREVDGDTSGQNVGIYRLGVRLDAD